MIKRLPTEAPHALRLSLWTRLGDIAIKQLHDRKLALAAFEAAAALEPGDVARQETLAHLYELSGPETREQAIASHQRLLARDPHRTDSYRALAKLYGDGNEIDKQWCVASALYYLKKADPSIDAIFRRYRPAQIRLPQRPFTEEIWQRVMHPDEDRLLVRAVRGRGAVSVRADREDRRPTWGWGGGTASTWRSIAAPPVLAVIQLAEVMGLPMPELFRGENENAQTVDPEPAIQGEAEDGAGAGAVDAAAQQLRPGVRSRRPDGVPAARSGSCASRSARPPRSSWAARGAGARRAARPASSPRTPS